MTGEAPLRILVIDENPIRRAILDAGLKDAGFTNIALLGDTKGLLDRIHAVDPDVIIIDLQNPSRDVPRADVPGLAHRAPTDCHVR
jgi:two-component system, response regulator / RNA-binding antiterminator